MPTIIGADFRVKGDISCEGDIQLEGTVHGNIKSLRLTVGETGVVEDSEVDRVTDIDLLDENFTPVADGTKVRITDLAGRARLYRLKGKDGKPVLAEGIAVSLNCDLVVAIVVGNRLDDPAVRKQAHEFIESNTVQVWVNKILEGR